MTIIASKIQKEMKRRHPNYRIQIWENAIGGLLDVIEDKKKEDEPIHSFLMKTDILCDYIEARNDSTELYAGLSWYFFALLSILNDAFVEYEEIGVYFHPSLDEVREAYNFYSDKSKE